MSADVALLVPAYNAASYIERLASAARAQTQPFGEWLCYDDGSTDDTALAARRAGFQVIVGERNRGPSYARNRLAEAARSAWLHFHDADDLMAPDYVRRVAALATDECDVALCDSSWELETTRKRLILWTYEQAAYERDPLGYVVGNPVGVISAVVRRRVFLEAGGFDEKATCWEDADLFVRLAERDARFRMLPETLVTSLRGDAGISRDQLHCDRCRLAFLLGYVRRHPRSLAPVHAREFEKLIPRLIAHGDMASARQALAACRSLGGSPPSTANPVLRLMKTFVPAIWLLRLQHAYRAHRRDGAR